MWRRTFTVNYDSSPVGKDSLLSIRNGKLFHGFYLLIVRGAQLMLCGNYAVLRE